MSTFFFTRLKYNSGNWDTDQRMPSNLLNSLVEYTTIPVDEKEKNCGAQQCRDFQKSLLLPEWT